MAKKMLVGLSWLVGLVLAVAVEAATYAPSSPFVAMSPQGRPLAGGNVTVTSSTGGVVTVYADAGGTLAFSKQVPSTGIVQFFGAAGTYLVTVSGEGVTLQYQVNIPTAAGGLTDANFAGTGLMKKDSTNNYSTVRINATTSAPTVTDDVNAGYSVFSEWINLSTNTVYTCINNAAGAAVWVSGSGGIATINGENGPAISFVLGTAGNNPAWSASSDAIKLDLPNASDVARGLITPSNQIIGGHKWFSGSLDINLNYDSASTLTVATHNYPYAFNSDPANDQLNFFIGQGYGQNGWSNFRGFNARAAVEVTQAGNGNAIDAYPGTGNTYGVRGISGAGNTGGGVLGFSAATGSRAALFTRSISSSTVPVVEMIRNQASDNTPILSMEDDTTTSAAAYAQTYKLNGVAKWGFGTNGQIVGTALLGSNLPTFASWFDEDTGLGFMSGEPCLVDEGEGILCVDGPGDRTVINSTIVAQSKSISVPTFTFIGDEDSGVSGVAGDVCLVDEAIPAVCVSGAGPNSSTAVTGALNISTGATANDSLSITSVGTGKDIIVNGNEFSLNNGILNTKLQTLTTVPSYTFIGDEDSGLGNAGGSTSGVCLIDEAIAGLCVLGNAANTQVIAVGSLTVQTGSTSNDSLIITNLTGTGNQIAVNATQFVVKGGEVKWSGVSGDGVGKVLCVKADGNIGSCTTTVGAGGTCTCA